MNSSSSRAPPALHVEHQMPSSAYTTTCEKTGVQQYKAGIFNAPAPFTFETTRLTRAQWFQQALRNL